MLVIVFIGAVISGSVWFAVVVGLLAAFWVGLAIYFLRV
jgi:hypothetical protein